MAKQDENDRLATIKVKREAEEHRQLRRIRVRERLQQSARDSIPATQAERERARLRVYLGDWAASQGKVQQKLSAAGSSLSEYMKSSSPTMTELLGASNAWALGVVDVAIDELMELPQGSDMRAALRVRWLNEGVSKAAQAEIRVFRSGRLALMTLDQVDDLADQAERALIPICKRKGLPL